MSDERLATLTLPNTLDHQQICREIRDFHKQHKRPLAISFPDAMSRIRLQARRLYLPNQRALTATEAVIDGIVKKRNTHYEIHPRNSGKTIHVHLDPCLAKEFRQVRSLFPGKSQRDIIHELLLRGLRSVQEEQQRKLDGAGDTTETRL